MILSIVTEARHSPSPSTLLVLVEGGEHAGEDCVDGLAVDHVEGCPRFVEIIILLCNNTNELRGFVKDIVQLLEAGRFEGVPIPLCAPEEVPIVLRLLALLVVDHWGRVGLCDYSVDGAGSVV